MQGEYRGDFTRDTFHRANHFCRVLMQQGRVQLDADWNEQASILLDFMRSLAADLIGQHGGPMGPAGLTEPLAGFAITPTPTNNPPDLLIGPGHYYVDGILCEATTSANASGTASSGLTYLTQPDLPKPPGLPSQRGVLVYLDVWERHVTCFQQDLLRELALGGPDTATRAKVVWQVKIATDPKLLILLDPLPKSSPAPPKFDIADTSWQDLIAHWQSTNRGFLAARVQPQQTSTDPCVISPKSSYRGAENQLYRVEIHNGTLSSTSQTGSVAPTDAITATPAATSIALTVPNFKWSRENGSVVFPILKLVTGAGQTKVTLACLGRDSNLSLQINDWVEVVDDNSALSGTVDLLLQVQTIDPVKLVVTLGGGQSAIVVDPSVATHPILRRWDGIGPISKGPPSWLTLEDGIQIQFQPPPTGTSTGPTNQYRSGDYWLIPARVATGDIEWPRLRDAQGKPVLDANNEPIPDALQPHGVEHHYAPLAYIPGTPTGPTSVELRRFFTTQAK